MRFPTDVLENPFLFVNNMAMTPGFLKQNDLFICICLCLGWRFLEGADTYTATYWQNPFQVYDYYAYHNVRVLSFEVPPQTTQSTWIFTGISEEKCNKYAPRRIHLFIQHRSLPVINPLNETFPADFNLDRTWLREVIVYTKNRSISFTLKAPLPGTWVAVAFMAREEGVDKIKQKGLSGKRCLYFLGSTHIIEAIDDIHALKTGKQHSITVKSGTDQLYRFHTSDVTWEYSIVVSNCSYHAEGNSSQHEVDVLCPLLMSARGSGLAHLDVASPQINCSAMESPGDCVLIYVQPETNAWHYLLLNLPAQYPGRLQLELLIATKECISIQSDRPKDETTTQQPAVQTTNATLAPMLNGISSARTVSTQRISGSTIVTPSLVQYSDIIAQANHNSSSAMLHVNVPDKTKSHHNPTMETNDRMLSSCVWVPELGRFSESFRPYNVQFTLRMGTIPLANLISVPDTFPMVLKFSLKPDLDTGGTLKFQIDMPHTGTLLNTTVQHVKVEACIMQKRIPVTKSGVSCPRDNMLSVNSSHEANQPDQVYFPYPEPGNWYITFLASCYQKSKSGTVTSVPCAQSSIPLRFVTSLTGCVDNGCGQHGVCKEYFSGVYHFSSCECIAKWRGYGCTDGSVAESRSMQLTAALLLTLSNMMFMPAIFLAIWRGYYIEALVYFYTMFFSSFYHACDGDRQYIYCLMPMSVLSFCDFFSSILSFWVTLVAMSRLSQNQRSFMYVVAALGLAIGVAWDKHSAWTFVVPCGVSLIVTLISWCVQCHLRHQCYPGGRRWVLFLLPGVLCAAAGLVIFAFFETEDNYRYTHSAWHMFCAVAIVFLLPPRRQAKPGTEPLPLPFRAFDQPAEMNDLHDDSSDDPMLDLEGATLVSASFHRIDNAGVSYVV